MSFRHKYIKEKIVVAHQSGEHGFRELCRRYGMAQQALKGWISPVSKRKIHNLYNLQSLSEAYDPIGFLKSQRHMKPNTGDIIKLAIAGKFGTTFFFCPFFTF